MHIEVECECCGHHYAAEPEGGHRLLVGDATSADDVARLMDGETFRCMWTDPPYGVNHSGGSKDPRSATYRSGAKLKNDALGDPETQRLVTSAFTLAAEYGTAGASAYVAAPAVPLHRRFIDAMDNSGFTYRHQLIWVKDHFVFGRSDYHYRHEPILYGWLETGAHYFTDDRTQDGVFEVPRPKRSEDHPTMKPLALVATMVCNSSRDGEVVYDPFCGSGTTLLAAERLGRQCRAIEIDPRFADVILRRWEAETGREATLLERVAADNHDDGEAEDGTLTVDVAEPAALAG